MFLLSGNAGEAEGCSRAFIPSKALAALTVQCGCSQRSARSRQAQVQGNRRAHTLMAAEAELPTLLQGSVRRGACQQRLEASSDGHRESQTGAGGQRTEEDGTGRRSRMRWCAPVCVRATHAPAPSMLAPAAKGPPLVATLRVARGRGAWLRGHMSASGGASMSSTTASVHAIKALMASAHIDFGHLGLACASG